MSMEKIQSDTNADRTANSHESSNTQLVHAKVLQVSLIFRQQFSNCFFRSHISCINCFGAQLKKIIQLLFSSKEIVSGSFIKTRTVSFCFSKVHMTRYRVLSLSKIHAISIISN